MKSLILKHALKNAFDFNGSVNDKVVLGAILKESSELRTKVPEVLKEIQVAIKEVSKLSKEEIKKKLEKLDPELLKEKKEEKKEGLKDLDGVDKKKGVIMRFAPSPSGPMHIGHAITGGLTSVYVKRYGGKFILRIEDTNSDNIDSDAYDMLPKDAEWIFGNVTEVWIQSDRLKIYYDYAEKFINLSSCYVCTCSQEEFKSFSEKLKDCPCRKNSVKENLARWKKMFDKKGFKEGEAVLRFKSSMQDKNPAMRDFPLVRINDSEHPRQGLKYRVWPLMNLCVTVDDIEAGMTHIIRAKDHADNAKRQEMMYKALGLGDKFPRTYFLGRYNFEGMEISCSKTKAKILEGVYTGWDDIRIPFLAALKRRGYQPGAFLKYTELVGVSPVDKTVPQEEFWKSINAFNRDIIEPQANRYFFVDNPKKVKIMGAPKKTAELDLHPNFPEKGKRKIKGEEDVFIESKEILAEGKLHRLMDYCNFEIKKGKYQFVSNDYEEYKNAENKGSIIHWLPVSENIKVEVLMDDASIHSGVGELNMQKLKVGDLVQLERHFYARVDEKSKDKIKFWYLHK
ncbi:MAG: glutamate--tRNA ligase [Nanoarchaeota archaeon]